MQTKLFVHRYNGKGNHKFNDELVPSRQSGKTVIELHRVIKAISSCSHYCSQAYCCAWQQV